MSNTRKNEDVNCIKGQNKRDNDIHDYCLNRPSNNCTNNNCFETNPEIRVPHNTTLIDRTVENKLFRLNSKDNCDPNNHSCDGNICKTQVFENTDKNNDCKNQINTINSRLDEENYIMEKSYDRFEWLHYSPQKHTESNDTHLSFISSRLDIKNNYKSVSDTKPLDATNELEYNSNPSPMTYEVVELPSMHQNPEKKNNNYKFL